MVLISLFGQRLRLAAAPTDPGSCSLPAAILRSIKARGWLLLGGVQVVAGLGVLSAGGAVGAVVPEPHHQGHANTSSHGQIHATTSRW
jgi:hypothetical protein